MYRLTLTILIAALLVSCSQDKRLSTFSGTISSVDGSIPQLAHIHILPFGENPYSAPIIIQADADGRFELTLPNQEYLEVMVTASDHQRLLFPLLMTKKGQTIQAKIQLKQNPFKDDLSGVRITGDWNNFAFGTASPMLAQPDGSYLFEMKSQADTVAYQLLDIVSDGRSVNGTNQDKLVYDGGGDYKSLVSVKEGKVQIHFDPSQLKTEQTQGQAGVELLNGNETMQQILRIARRSEQDKYLEHTQKQTHLQDHKNLNNFNYDRKPFRDYIRATIESASSQLVKRYAMLQLVRRTSPKDENAKTIYQDAIQTLPLQDPLWAEEALSAGNVFIQALGSDKAKQLFMDEYENIPNKKVQAGVLIKLGLIAKRDGDLAEQSRLYGILTSDYAHIKGIGYYVDQLNPDQGIAKGKNIPDFEVKNMDGTKILSNKKLLGKTYLIDFWATWCAPCVEEMPNLHAVYETYKDKNFTIISFSYDRNPEAVSTFRRDKWAMPWQHIFLSGAEKETITKEFEVDGIPKPILVDAQGTIIATEIELRGDDLAKTLGKYLGN